jgi:hypothetical protein
MSALEVRDKTQSETESEENVAVKRDQRGMLGRVSAETNRLKLAGKAGK